MSISSSVFRLSCCSWTFKIGLPCAGDGFLPSEAGSSGGDFCSSTWRSLPINPFPVDEGSSLALVGMPCFVLALAPSVDADCVGINYLNLVWLFAPWLGGAACLSSSAFARPVELFLTLQWVSLSHQTCNGAMGCVIQGLWMQSKVCSWMENLQLSWKPMGLTRQEMCNQPETGQGLGNVLKCWWGPVGAVEFK